SKLMIRAAPMRWAASECRPDPHPMSRNVRVSSVLTRRNRARCARDSSTIASLKFFAMNSAQFLPKRYRTSLLNSVVMADTCTPTVSASIDGKNRGVTVVHTRPRDWKSFSIAHRASRKMVGQKLKVPPQDGRVTRKKFVRLVGREKLVRIVRFESSTRSTSNGVTNYLR